MQENNNITNTNSQEQTLSQVTNTTTGTAEQGALKTIHRSYNKLNGFEAMLHIIDRFRFVLYPFIFLSIAGSTYSFYNDFLVSFPMLGNNINLIVAFFYSVMLEIVRDGAIIAIFNSKMNLASRALIIGIFLAVTSYMYGSHLKAIDVIEKHAIEYTLAHQNDSTVKATNPKYDLAVSDLTELKKDLAEKKKEKSDDLIKNSTSIHINKRTDALTKIAQIDNDVKKIKIEIKSKNSEIISFKEENIQSIEDSQKLISSILLATLLLTESLAMLGAVIKFINTDNAKKEIAKHSEIVEEYVEVSEQMKRDNEELTKNLANVVKGQSESNQQVMKMISDDMRESSKLNIQFINAIAQNKQETLQQMNQVLQAVNRSTIPTFDQPMQEVAEYKEAPTRQIGFKANSKEEIVTRLFQGGAVEADEKLTTKEKVVGKASRSRNEAVSEVYKILVNNGAIKRDGNKGYFAKTDYQTALRMLG